MPNWCMNTMNITHEDPEKIEEIVSRLNNLETDKYKDLLGFLKAFDPGWSYREAVSANYELIDDAIVANFDTAWSPPTELYEYLDEQGFNVWATYYEPGMALAGIYEDGYDNQVDIGDVDDDFWDTPLGKELDENWCIREEMMEWEEEEDLE